MNKDGTTKNKNKKDLMSLSPGSFNKAMDDIFSEKAMDDLFKVNEKDLGGYKFGGGS